jgi:hypothetical protein
MVMKAWKLQLYFQAHYINIEFGVKTIQTLKQILQKHNGKIGKMVNQACGVWHALLA